MKTISSGAAESGTAGGESTFRWRLKTAALAVLMAGLTFAGTGCYDDPHYYGHRGVRAGYYASYAAPAPYYAYDPYPYGYGYGPGVAIGVSSYRSHPGYGRRPYYGRGDYRRGYDGRRYDGRRYDRRRWDGRRARSRDRSEGRRATSERRVIRRSTAPVEQERVPLERQPE